MNERLEHIGSAAAGIAHDINNQLTLILNHLAVTDLDGAREAAFRCSALTSSLLSYCRGERLSFRPVNIAEFLRGFAMEISIPQGVHLIIEAPDGLPEIKADALALARVITNLANNACDAMNGVGVLRITASPACIEVSDSGPGIAPENQRHIFEPFFSTKGSRGTGLGLAIVREIMRQHGGAVAVSSEPGRGARFVLKFRR